MNYQGNRSQQDRGDQGGPWEKNNSNPRFGTNNNFNRGINNALNNTTNDGGNRGGAFGGNNYQNRSQQEGGGYDRNNNRNFPTTDGGSNFNPNQGGQRYQKDGNFNKFKQVIQVLNEVVLTENFLNSSICLVGSGQAQSAMQQQFQQPQQNYLDKLQIALCNGTQIQIHSAEKTDLGMRLISGGTIPIENANYTIDKCFAIKNLANDGLDSAVFSIVSTQGMYGFTIIKTNSQQNNQITQQVSAMVAHDQPIINVILFNNRIVTISSPSPNDQFIKFWAFENGNLVVDNTSTLTFNSNIQQYFTSKNLKLTTITAIEFVQIGNNNLIALSFENRFSKTEFPSQNNVYILEVEIQQVRAINGIRVEVGPATASIQKMKVVQNPSTGDNHIFVSLRNDTRQQQQQNQGAQNQDPQGFIYQIKNFSTATQIYDSKFPLSDFCVSLGRTQGTIIAATNRSIQPITWVLATDSFTVNKMDQNIQNQGDIQNVYLFKSTCNLVEINQLLTIHYPGNSQKGKPKKCISLSSLTLLENFEKDKDAGDRPPRQFNNSYNTPTDQGREGGNTGGYNNSQGGNPYNRGSNQQFNNNRGNNPNYRGNNNYQPRNNQ